MEFLDSNMVTTNNTNPTSVQFIQSFKKIFCLQYFKHSPGANCLEDQVLTHVNEQPSTQINWLFVSEEQNHPFNFKSIKIGTTGN